MINNIEITEELCGELWPYIQNDDITDIRWNGNKLWLNDLKKGRYVAKNENGEDVKLDPSQLEIFCSKVANANNVTFNYSNAQLQADLKTLRVQAVHPSVACHSKLTVSIRKTPACARLDEQNLVEEGYMDELTNKLIPCLMRARLSGFVIGEVGAGKTELQKWMMKFIPWYDAIYTVEDTAEMKADELYPEKDIIPLKCNELTFTEKDAIKTGLRMLNKWLILAEARGDDILNVITGASSSCTALCSIHCENTWDVPDRIMNMIGKADRDEGVKNDIFTFFKYAIKVRQHITKEGIRRDIDQISFFYRENEQNHTVRFIQNGRLTGEKLPQEFIDKINNAEFEDVDQYELPFLELYNNKMQSFNNNQQEGANYNG